MIVASRVDVVVGGLPGEHVRGRLPWSLWARGAGEGALEAGELGRSEVTTAPRDRASHVRERSAVKRLAQLALDKDRDRALAEMDRWLLVGLPERTRASGVGLAALCDSQHKIVL
jgi:hypothetical protein